MCLDSAAEWIIGDGVGQRHDGVTVLQQPFRYVPTGIAKGSRHCMEPTFSVRSAHGVFPFTTPYRLGCVWRLRHHLRREATPAVYRCYAALPDRCKMLFQFSEQA